MLEYGILVIPLNLLNTKNIGVAYAILPWYMY